MRPAKEKATAVYSFSRGSISVISNLTNLASLFITSSINSSHLSEAERPIGQGFHKMLQ